MIYLITYSIAGDLRKNQVITEIKSCPDWMSYLDDVWLVWSARTATQLEGALNPMLGPADRLLIIAVDPKKFGGFLHTDAWKWLRKY